MHNRTAGGTQENTEEKRSPHVKGHGEEEEKGNEGDKRQHGNSKTTALDRKRQKCRGGEIAKCFTGSVSFDLKEPSKQLVHVNLFLMQQKLKSFLC